MKPYYSVKHVLTKGIIELNNPKLNSRGQWESGRGYGELHTEQQVAYTWSEAVDKAVEICLDELSILTKEISLLKPRKEDEALGIYNGRRGNLIKKRKRVCEKLRDLLDI